MCNDCGCSDKNEKKTINLEKDIMSVNNELAKQNNHFLLHKKTFLINIMGSPGAGKTTFIEQISEYLGKENICVIQGDLESDVDKERLEKKGINTFQINTHSGCHLNAKMINNALMEMNIKDKKYLFVENVGNLVCPANIDMGQEMNMVISSTTEGSDKPKKYPIIFANCELIVISKMDLAEYVDFYLNEYINDIKTISANCNIFKTTRTDSKSYEKIAEYITEKYNKWISNIEHHHHH